MEWCNKKGEIQIETKLEYKNRSNIEHESKRELDVEIKVKVRSEKNSRQQTINIESTIFLIRYVKYWKMLSIQKYEEALF